MLMLPQVGYSGKGPPSGGASNPANIPAEQAEEAARALRLFLREGQLTELRAFTEDGPMAGFYEYGQIGLMAQHAVELSPRSSGVYFVLNPIRRGTEPEVPAFKRLGCGKVGVARSGEQTAD